MRPALVTYDDPDDALELRIRAELDASEAAQALGHRAKAGDHWRRFVELVSQRSERKVREMERERGLIR